jgi:hypothetical protein
MQAGNKSIATAEEMPLLPASPQQDLMEVKANEQANQKRRKQGSKKSKQERRNEEEFHQGPSVESGDECLRMYVPGGS